MNAQRVLAAEEIVAVTGIVAGELLNPTGGIFQRFPSPRRVVATFAFYGLLGLVASLGQQAARVAAGIGALVMLVTLLGPAGNALSGLLGKLTAFAQTPAGSEPPAPPASSAPGASASSGASNTLKHILQLIPGGATAAPEAGIIAKGITALGGALGIGKSGPKSNLGPTAAHQIQTSPFTGRPGRVTQA